MPTARSAAKPAKKPRPLPATPTPGGGGAYRTERDRVKARPPTRETEHDLIRYTLIVNAVEADMKAAQ